MKKGVIIAIIVAYIASILVVQFFGLQVIGVEGNVYITDIEVRGFEFTNRAHIVDAQYQKVVKLRDTSGREDIHYGGYFYPGVYDTSAESLASNPNRVKVIYDIVPYNATYTDITFAYDAEANDQNVIYLDPETQEIVFLKPRSVTFVLTTQDGSTIRKEIMITLT